MHLVKSTFLFCFFLLVPFALFSQKTYQFRLIDQVSKQPIPYATIGLIQQNTGGSTDTDGKLTLTNIANPSDSILVSCLGYENKHFPLARLSFQNLNTIELESKVYTMQAVEIKSREFSTKTLVLGKFNQKDYLVGHLVSEYSQQAARKFTLEDAQKGGLLRSVSYLVKRIPPQQISTFRVRVYALDETTGKPGYDLLTTPIIRTVHENNEIIKVDLSSYRIVPPTSGFFVAFEWIKTKENSIPLQKPDGTTKDGFIPLLGASNEKSEACWILNYKHEWENRHQFNLAISAEISPLKK